MNYLLIADAYEPATISAAQQLRDLVTCLTSDASARITVLIPDISDTPQSTVDIQGNITLIRAKCLKTKDVNYFRRTITEFLLPFYLYKAYQKSSCAKDPLHGIIWYSPTIFLGPIVAWLKRKHACRTYLILRDLFPDWAADAGIMRKGLAYRILKWVEAYQYRQADVIGVQTPANLPHLLPWQSEMRRIEVLQNWLAPECLLPCDLVLDATHLAGRRIVVYAGNMGVAQDMLPVLEMVKRLRHRQDWGFIFVGRGSEVENIRRFIESEALDNVLLRDEIPPEQIPGLFAQCDIGLLALNPRHTTHNIPGKFVAYTRSGLPVLARINPGNDLLKLINEGEMGIAVEDTGINEFVVAAEKLMNLSDAQLLDYKNNARVQWQVNYSVQSVVNQIIQSLNC